MSARTTDIVLALGAYREAVRRSALAPHYGTHGDNAVRDSVAAEILAYRALVALIDPELAAHLAALDAMGEADSVAHQVATNPTAAATEMGLRLIGSAL